MKIKNTLMIVTLVAGSMLAANVAVRAQDSTNAPAHSAKAPGAPGAGGRMTFETVSKNLSLTEDQKPKVKPIIEEMQQKMSDLRGETLERTERAAKGKEIRDAATAKLKPILTAEQMTKWQAMGKPGRRPQGAAGAPAANPPASTEKK